MTIDEEYREEKQPDKKQRYENWTTAKGLQAVDGLVTSAYLERIAKEHIEGRYDSYRAKQLIDSYYQTVASAEEITEHAEADMVASRINILIGERAFSLTTEELLSIHKRLFEGVFDFAGEIRKGNIQKAEWVLMGDTVVYGDAYSLKDNLDSLLKKERLTPLHAMDDEERLYHLTQFCSDLWQLHPFNEGNTRTTAVFVIKYLKKMGYEVDNSLFQKHSRYFRDALVRANYSNVRLNVFEDMFFLENFFSDLIGGTKHVFSSRLLLIGQDGETVTSKEKDIKITIAQAILHKPSITKKELSEIMGVSTKTIERKLKEMGYSHSGARKKGQWEGPGTV